MDIWGKQLEGQKLDKRRKRETLIKEAGQSKEREDMEAERMWIEYELPMETHRQELGFKGQGGVKKDRIWQCRL